MPAVRRLRLIGIVAGSVLVVWIVALLVIGAVFGERQAQAVADRIGESLQAKATIRDHDLGLIRGRLSIAQLEVRREDVTGTLSLDVGAIRCELLPVGGALFDSSCRELAISDLRLELSTFALFKLRKPTRRPLRAERVTLDDATLVFSPATVVPSLGRIALRIDRASAGPTVLKTPLSWLFQLETLHATLETPFGEIRLDYDHGMLRAGGGVLGKTPVTLPFQMPVTNLAEEPLAELQRLVKIGKRLAEQLVEQKARDWLRSKLP